MRKKVLLLLALFLTVSLMFIATGCPPAADQAQNGEVVAPVETITWKMQTPWPTGMYLHDGPLRFAEKVEAMSGGRLKIEVTPAGTIVGAFDILDAVSDGVLDAGQGWAAYWAGRHPAAHLFSSTVGGPFGMDNLDYVSWLYFGGGLELYRQLYTEEMGLNVKVFPMDIIVEEPLGWFKEEITSLEELKGLKMRESGLTAEVYSKAGITVVAMPGGEILPSLERGVIDAAAFMCPTSDKQLGLMDVAKYYHTPSLHRPSGTLELLINQDRWNELPADLQAIVEVAAKETLLHTWMRGIFLNSADLQTLKEEHDVQIVRTPDDVLEMQLEAWAEVAAGHSANNPFFAEVFASQREHAERVVRYRREFYLPYGFASDHYWAE